MKAFHICILGYLGHVPGGLLEYSLTWLLVTLFGMVKKKPLMVVGDLPPKKKKGSPKGHGLNHLVWNLPREFTIQLRQMELTTTQH